MSAESSKAAERHIGVSGLRQMNVKTLKQFNADEAVAIIHEHSQPIAAIVSYKLFMAWQETIQAQFAGIGAAIRAMKGCASASQDGES